MFLSRFLVSRSLSLIKHTKTIWPRNQTLPSNSFHGQGVLNRYFSTADTSKYRHPVYNLTCLPYTKDDDDDEEFTHDQIEHTMEEFLEILKPLPPPRPLTEEEKIHQELVFQRTVSRRHPIPIKDFKDPPFYPFIKECATFALRDYTRQTGDIYELVEIDKVNYVLVNGTLNYVTFRAMSPQKECVSFQATLYQCEDKLEVVRVNIKTLGSDRRYDVKFSESDEDLESFEIPMFQLNDIVSDQPNHVPDFAGTNDAKED